MIRSHGLVISVLLIASSCFGQASSLSARKRAVDAAAPPAAKSRVAVPRRGNAVAERHTWIAVKPKDPPTYKVHDLITIIVREQRTFEADSEMKRKKDYNLTSEVKALLKLTRGGLGAADFQRGRPDVDYNFKTETKGRADSNREDRLVTRLTGRIVDIKPNGVLVLEAKARVVHDDEVSMVTLTGKARKADITADNTVLSTQLADKDITIQNDGEVRDAIRRGWIPRLIDFFRPF